VRDVDFSNPQGSLSFSMRIQEMKISNIPSILTMYFAVSLIKIGDLKDDFKENQITRI
jgi:hypothetical protein